MTGKAKSGMFIGILSTYASHWSIWVASACITGPYGLPVVVLVCIISDRVISGATRATTHTGIIVPRVYVFDERKAHSDGMARHGTRIGTAYICALSSSSTEDSGD